MLKHDLFGDESILVLTPEAPLQAKDFEIITSKIDSYIEQTGYLRGLMIQTESFPGWDNLAACLSHLKFIRNHHQKIEKVAEVTDSGFLAIMARISSHFIKAQIRHFPFEEKEAAMAWIKSDNVGRQDG